MRFLAKKFIFQNTEFGTQFSTIFGTLSGKVIDILNIGRPISSIGILQPPVGEQQYWQDVAIFHAKG